MSNKKTSRAKKAAHLSVVNSDVTPPAELPAECCVKCRFFLPDSAEQGLCRRYPPVPVMTMNGLTQAFPCMLNVGYCGEFIKLVDGGTDHA